MAEVDSKPQVDMVSKKARYEELYTKPEAELKPEEAEELIRLSQEIDIPVEETKIVVEGKVEPETPKKKYAGIYENVEDLLKGVNSSESERKRIASELTEEQINELEDTYKDSQRKVTRLVQEKKKVTIQGKPALQDRRLNEMTAEEYSEWEAKDKLQAHAWLSEATMLNESQKKSATKVYAKHPEFFAMLSGVTPPSKEFQEFDRACLDHPEWNRLPNGPELALEEMEKALGKTHEELPKPKKEAEKPGFSHATGKAQGAAKGKPTRLTEEEFAQLSPDAQQAYLDGQFKG